MNLHLPDFLRDIPDFPKPGILFKDISPLLANAQAFAQAVAAMADPFAGSGLTAIVGIESRGFIFAAAAALRLQCGFVPIRKPGKLPGATRSRSYALEYGEDRIEIQADALPAGSQVLVMDDVLATGGTLAAAVALCQDLDLQVLATSCLLEIPALQGRQRLSVPCHALLQ